MTKCLQAGDCIVARTKEYKMTYSVEGLTGTRGEKNHVRHIGDYDTLANAISASIQVIDQFLLTRHEQHMTVADLYSLYEDLGEVPVIFSNNDETISMGAFNHFKFAKSRCTELCAARAYFKTAH
jgi:hypothetical protein